MLAVGIDVSKSKSVAAILNQDGSVHTKPFVFHHDQPETNALIKYIKEQNQPVTILMENTGHYHYPVLKAFEEAELQVCLINAYQMKKYGDMELRKAKTDKKDALRIARYALEKGYTLVPHTSMDQKYEDLRFLLVSMTIEWEPLQRTRYVRCQQVPPNLLCKSDGSAPATVNLSLIVQNFFKSTTSVGSVFAPFFRTETPKLFYFILDLYISKFLCPNKNTEQNVNHSALYPFLANSVVQCSFFSDTVL